MPGLTAAMNLRRRSRMSATFSEKSRTGCPSCLLFWGGTYKKTEKKMRQRNGDRANVPTAAIACEKQGQRNRHAWCRQIRSGLRLQCAREHGSTPPIVSGASGTHTERWPSTHLSFLATSSVFVGTTMVLARRSASTCLSSRACSCCASLLSSERSMISVSVSWR